MRRRWFQLLACLLSGVLVTAIGRADAPTPAGGTEAPAVPQPSLDQLQLQVKKDFERFEKSLFNVAEGLRKNEPDRAELLYRARTQSETQRLADEMTAIANLLEKKARKPGDEASAFYGQAGERQEELVARLDELLKILQSENERDRIAKEIARIQELIKDTNRVIGKQKDVRADTERGGKPGEKLEESQDGVIKETDRLAKKIDRQDQERAGESGKSSPSKPSDKPPSGKPGEKGDMSEPMPGEDSKEGDASKESKPGQENKKPKPGDQKPKPDDKPSDDPMKPDGEQKPSDNGSPSDPSQGKPQNGKPMPGQPMSGQPMPGQPMPGQPMPMGEKSQSPMGDPMGGQPQNPQDEQQKDSTPGREQLDEARKAMEQAIEELKKKKNDKAIGDQDDAVAQLEQLKAKLEEILRQLRQEEKDIYLAMLEARLQKMLRAQLKINTETVRLEGVDKGARASQSTALSKDEAANSVEADKTLNLLKEEGSSVAFPEAIEQMRDNMRLVTGRLDKSDTGETTQLIEQMIVEGLEEMLLAVQQEMEKARQQKNQQGKQKSGQPQDKELVAQLQELKMIRSLQNQVNRLTRQIGVQIEGEQASDADTLKLAEDLARRQKRIQEATYDLSTGKNK
jgi:hypothetical protein